MGTRREEREAKICDAINTLIRNCEARTSEIRLRWRDNYEMFVDGTKFTDKEEWQTKMSLNKFQSAIRAAQGRLVDILVNTPDWFKLEAKSPHNARAAKLGPAFQKAMEYYMDAASFKRHASTFFLCSLISMGTLVIGWRKRLLQNPEYILEKTEKERQKVAQRLAKNVVNPDVVVDDSVGDVASSIEQAISDLTDEMNGTSTKPETPPYLQVGCLDFMEPNHEQVYWDPLVQYMEDSSWRAFSYEIPRYELDRAAKQGFFSRAKVKAVGGRKDINTNQVMINTRYKKLAPAQADSIDTVKITVYYGPIIVQGKGGDASEIMYENYFCVLANDNFLLKEGEYPYWEPPGHNTAVISTAVKQIPYRATGAGIGDNAAQLQKTLDANYMLICDTFRYGIAGVNVVDYNNLVDKAALDEGIYPGMTLEVRGEPKKTFEHFNFTSNLENQNHPIQSAIERAIDDQTGTNSVMMGGGNPYARTSAAETNSKVQAGANNVNMIALDLEQNFLKPALQKIFARVLQFGLLELNTNPELAALFDEDEMHELLQLTAQEKITILNQFYNFSIKGFSSAQDKNEAAQRDNELLQIINSGGIMQSLIHVPNFMRNYFKNREIKDVDNLLITDSNLEIVTSENQVMMKGHAVQVNPHDDHEFHLKLQLPLAQSPYATPELQMHVQWHMAAMQGMQTPGQGAPPQQGQPQQVAGPAQPQLPPGQGQAPTLAQPVQTAEVMPAQSQDMSDIVAQLQNLAMTIATRETPNINVAVNMAEPKAPEVEMGDINVQVDVDATKGPVTKNIVIHKQDDANWNAQSVETLPPPVVGA